MVTLGGASVTQEALEELRAPADMEPPSPAVSSVVVGCVAFFLPVWLLDR